MKSVRLLSLAGALAAALAVAGCVTVDGGKVTTTDPRAQAVINAVATGCSFIPLLETVAALFNKRPNATITDLKNLICRAVQNTTAAQGRRGPLRAPVVAGVKIKGDFVDGRSLR